MTRLTKRVLIYFLLAHAFGVMTPSVHAQQAPANQASKSPAASVAPPPIKLKWTQAASMPVGVFDAAGSLVDHRLFVVTGGLWQSGLANDGVQVFDVSANSWSVVGKLNTPRFCHAQVALDKNRLLILGGQETKQVGKGSAILSAELLNIEDGTSEKLPDPVEAKPTRAPAGCMMANTAVFVGADRLYRFNLETNTWAPTVKLKASRDYSTVVPLDDRRLLIVAGAGRDSFEIADIVTGESKLLDVKLPFTIDDTQAYLLDDGRVWIAAGQDSKTGDTTDQTWFLSIDHAGAGALTNGPSLRVKNGVADHRLVLSPPHLFVLGGESQKAGTDTELNIARALNLRTMQVHTATGLPRACDDALAFEHAGRVFVVGGFYVGPPVLGTARLPYASREVYTATLPTE